MGILVPENFPMSSLKNDEERIVVAAFRDRLTDGWLVIPDVGLTGDRDRQTDIVLAHERDGVAVIEVKGHRAKVERGMWCCDGRPLSPQPLAQAQGNAYALRDRLRHAHPSLANLKVEYGVAFPNVAEVRGQLPTDVHAAQVLTAPALDHPQDAIDSLMSHRWGNQRIGSVGIEALVKTLRPDCDLLWDPEARARLARVRLEEICAQQIKVLERLDLNRRVTVTGGAGTGKTRLAIAWARRALQRDERVLVTCFNDPLADSIAQRLPDDDRLTVGSYFRVALTLPGMPELGVPDDADKTWWDTVAVGHLQTHWHEVTARYDTIVVDEAQDFNPAWLTQLSSLLDPDGPRRVLGVADEAQLLYARGFTLPAIDDGWTRCELVSNCRNSFHIADLLHRHLGGPAAPVGGTPETIGVDWAEANDIDEVVELVGEEIDRIIDLEGHETARVLIATFSSEVRDRLREDLALVPWEAGAPTTIVCENVHRMKGLEFDYVVLASPAADVSDMLLYVGVSRAVSGLTVIGPRGLAGRLGLA